MNPMFNNIPMMIKQIKQFKNTLQGDPNKQLQEMIDSGNVPQSMLNQAQSIAKPIYEAMKELV